MYSGNWISEGWGSLPNEQLCLCAFWGGWDMAYCYALGHWHKEHEDFIFAPNVTPRGKLTYCIPIETPPTPNYLAADYIEKPAHVSTDGLLNHICFRLDQIMKLLEKQK